MTISIMTLGRDTLPPERAAKIAAAAYLITTATAVFADFYVVARRDELPVRKFAQEVFHD
jgi:hypothetical protein